MQLELGVQQVQIGAADSGRVDLDPHARPFRALDLDDLDSLQGLADCAHADLPGRKVPTSAGG
jgi:hypothetical protein